MKKVLLVYPGYIVREQPLNILYIASAVKAAGHETAFFDVTPYRKRPLLGDEFRIMTAAFDRELEKFRPDVVGFSVMSVNTKISIVLAERVRRLLPSALNIFGGIHPTIAPEETIADPRVDAICLGEGEGAMTDWLAALDGAGDPSRIPGLWVKAGGRITRNATRPLLQEIDPLPFPDRGLLDPKRMNAELYGVNMLTSRGCPFPCTYCQNEFLMDMYKGLGKFVRYRSIDNVFAEIDEVLRVFKPSRLSFSDESFTLNKKRLAEFCDRYAKRYSIPFLCQTRPDLIDEETVRILADGRMRLHQHGHRGRQSAHPERRPGAEHPGRADRPGVHPGPPPRHPDGELQHDRPARRGHLDRQGHDPDQPRAPARPDHVHRVHALPWDEARRAVDRRRAGSSTRSTTPRSITRTSPSSIRRFRSGRSSAIRDSSITTSACRGRPVRSSISSAGSTSSFRRRATACRRCSGPSGKV